MKHTYFRDRLSAYLDRELPDKEQQLVADHLKECAECREELARLESLEKLVEENSRLSGDDYWESLARKIDERIGVTETTITDLGAERSKRRSGFVWKLSAVAASVLIVGYVGLHYDDYFEGKSTVPRHQAPAVKQPTSTIDSIRTPARIHDPETDQSGARLEEKGAEQEMEVPVRIQRPSVSQIAIPEPVKKMTMEPSASAEDQDVGLSETTSTLDQRIVQDKIQKALHESEVVQYNQGKAKAREEAAHIDENYKDRTPLMIETQSPDIEAISVQPTEKSEIFGLDDIGDLMQSELVRWRLVRDSLSGRGASTREKKHYAASLRKESPMGGAPDSTLLEAWFHICQLSSDSTERTRGVRFLESVAVDSTLPLYNLATEYLRKLDLR